MKDPYFSSEFLKLDIISYFSNEKELNSFSFTELDDPTNTEAIQQIYNIYIFLLIEVPVETRRTQAYKTLMRKFLTETKFVEKFFEQVSIDDLMLLVETETAFSKQELIAFVQEHYDLFHVFTLEENLDKNKIYIIFSYLHLFMKQFNFFSYESKSALREELNSLYEDAAFLIEAKNRLELDI